LFKKTATFPTRLHDHENSFKFLAKILTQTVRVSELLDDAKYFQNSSTLWLSCTNITNMSHRRHTELRRHTTNVTYQCSP